MKIRWYELLILALTAMTAAVFLAAWFATVRAPGISVSTQRGGAYEMPAEAADDEETPGVIDLNQATLDELMTLPGIGESRAQSIIDYREKYGGFRSVAELKKVPGITASVLDGLNGRVTVT